MNDVASQLLKALRGRRSQVAFSRRLKYRSNVAADWEQGRRYPTAGELVRACAVVGVDVADGFTRFHPTAAVAFSPSDAGIAAWLEALRGQTAIQDIAARTGLSRHALGRWLSGRTRPRLPDFLRLVDALTGRVQDLVAELVDIEQVPALAERRRRAAASRRVGIEAPWTLPVLLALETAGYAALSDHDTGWLARLLGLSEEQVVDCLDRLEEAGVIQREGRHYTVGGALTIDTRAHPEAGRVLKKHWLSVGMDRVDTPRSDDILGYNLFALSRTDLARIADLQRRFYREVRGIVAASEPSEVIALMNTQLVTWDPED
ncbi:MAG: transcriptional regulator with XRE-family HTH domain [Myxococcota bacterium]